MRAGRLRSLESHTARFNLQSTKYGLVIFLSLTQKMIHICLQELKKFLHSRSDKESKNLQSSSYLGAGAISKIIASIVTYPHQVYFKQEK
jgi:hypothetical protein